MLKNRHTYLNPSLLSAQATQFAPDGFYEPNAKSSAMRFVFLIFCIFFSTLIILIFELQKQNTSFKQAYELNECKRRDRQTHSPNLSLFVSKNEVICFLFFHLYFIFHYLVRLKGESNYTTHT